MAAPRFASAASTPGLSRWWLIFTGSDGGLDVRNPDALKLADSVSSEFFSPVGNSLTLITSRETEDLLHHASLFLNCVFF